MVGLTLLFTISLMMASQTWQTEDVLEHIDQLGTSKEKRQLWPAWMLMLTAHVPMNCTWAEFPVCCALLDESPSNFYPRVEKLPTFHHFAHSHHANTMPGSSSTSNANHNINKRLRRLDLNSNEPSVSSDIITITATKETSASKAKNSQNSNHDSSIFDNTEKLHTKCQTERHYIPSPYETTHIEKAIEVSKIFKIEDRRHALIDFIEKDIDHTNKWLRRVDFHMRDQRSAHEKYITSPHPDDLQYMSRFNITVICNGVSHQNWIEWIEPLSIHTRHPNGLIEHCNYLLPTEIRNSHKIEFHAPAITSPDYVLVQHNDDYLHRKILGKKLSPVRRKYFFDAGSNYFNTATAWFTCAYLQKGIDFDHIYTVEYERLDPVKYFQVTPPKMIPFVHFMNIPASYNHSESGSILRMIKQLAREQDFVSFKLDIDSPEIEIPIFLEILNNNDYSNLIDEFFFELHFRCEFMMQCGWDNKMPEEFKGIKMERSVVMKAFQKLRFKGVRAHFWP